jgi:hypothetical protein
MVRQPLRAPALSITVREMRRVRSKTAKAGSRPKSPPVFVGEPGPGASLTEWIDYAAMLRDLAQTMPDVEGMLEAADRRIAELKGGGA